MEKIMIFLDDRMTKVLIQTGSAANLLLRHGYKLVEVRPNRRNKIKTVFIFETGNKPQEIVQLIAKSELSKNPKNLFS